jgi:thiamine-monophosphate kinase
MPEQVGRRAVLAAVSDLAAMAAEPIAVLVSLSVPGGWDSELTEQVGRGCLNATQEMGAGLVGGDLSRGGQQLTLDVAALGAVSSPLLRSGVRPGDELWVSGRLGGAAAAVGAWKAGREPQADWRQRFWEPAPRVREARWLAELGASAAIDVSDGLIADAWHLSAASGVGIEIDQDAVPLAGGVAPDIGLAGGEDYELLVALGGGILSLETVSEFSQTFGIPLTRVGRAVSGDGVRVFRDGAEVELAAYGYDHFR